MSSRPLIQIAMDVLTIDDAVRLGGAATVAGADWLEIGKPLIEFAGITAVAELRRAFPEAYLLADMMIMAGAPRYVHAAADIGFDNVTVTALAPTETVEAAIAAGHERGVHVTVDLFNVADVAAAAQRYEQSGADYLMVHLGVDQRRTRGPAAALADLASVLSRVSIPVSFATYDAAEATAAVTAGAAVIVQGEPYISAVDPLAALTAFIATVRNIERTTP
jgi:3-hexulose-6-phosphate synthase